ncbi:hypothetical protein GCM10007387_27630 [Pseudoduganella albidiflava]|uniref:Uncharacterized protein n=1 Tax=Pseudoduganella albidiflava TaxID=321983 RepID=A0AA87XWX7_9BURK|nr:hypothetical protein GCM10007387_27630 [Pseudoduganella albidiflava]
MRGYLSGWLARRLRGGLEIDQFHRPPRLASQQHRKRNYSQRNDRMRNYGSGSHGASPIGPRAVRPRPCRGKLWAKQIKPP